MQFIVAATLAQRFAFSFLVPLVLASVVLVFQIDRWQEAKDEADAWISGPGPQCERVLSEIYTKHRRIKEEVCGGVVSDDCAARLKKLDAQIQQIRKATGCPISYWHHLNPLLSPFLFSPKSPGPFLEYSLGRFDLNIPEALAGFAGLAVLVFVLWDACCRFLIMEPKGWRRLILIVSVLASILVASYFLLEHRDEEGALIFGLPVLPLSLVALIYVHWAIHWIASGFRDDSVMVGPQIAQGAVHTTSTHERAPDPLETVEAPPSEPNLEREELDTALAVPGEVPSSFQQTEESRWLVVLHLWGGVCIFVPIKIWWREYFDISVGALGEVALFVACFLVSRQIVRSLWSRFTERQSRVIVAVALVVLFPIVMGGGGAALLAAFH